MIQVLKHGDAYYQRKFTCDNCGCIFIASFDECRHLRESQIACPECDQMIGVIEGHTLKEEDFLVEDTPDPCDILG